MPDKTGSGPSPLEQLVAARNAEKKTQRKKDTRVLASIALAAVVVIGGGVFAFVHFAPQSWRDQVTALVKSSASARPSGTAAPVVKLTAHPLSPVTANGPPADPFAGSPGDHWADGAAGIAFPAAKAHGPYSAAQVKAAYQVTRTLLIAASLNAPTLRGGAPKAYERLLNERQRAQFTAGLHTAAVNKDGTEKNTRRTVVSFAPGSTSFVTTVVKVHGTMKAGLTVNSGTEVLRITYDYLFVYAVEPPGNPAGWMRVVQQQYGTVDFGRWDEQGSSFEPWITDSYVTSGIDCGTRDGYIHPAYPLAASSGPPPSGGTQDPYSLATPAAGGPACHRITGT
jgi:cytoskeletal protein RodZ